MLDKVAEICFNNSEDMATFYIVLKLYLFTLSIFARQLSNDQAENVSRYITHAQFCITKWIQKFYEECFGGKNGDKFKNEIEVSYVLMSLCMYLCASLYNIFAYLRMCVVERFYMLRIYSYV